MKEIIFHVHRGGRFHNCGFVEFVDFGGLDELEKILANDMFVKNRDKKGRFCRPEWVECNGHHVAYVGEKTFDFDGPYDTWFVTNIKDCTDNELKQAILNCPEWDIELLKELNDEADERFI